MEPFFKKWGSKLALVIGLIAAAVAIYLAYSYEPADTRVETHHVAP